MTRQIMYYFLYIFFFAILAKINDCYCFILHNVFRFTLHSSIFRMYIYLCVKFSFVSTLQLTIFFSCISNSFSFHCELSFCMEHKYFLKRKIFKLRLKIIHVKSWCIQVIIPLILSAHLRRQAGDQTLYWC